MVYVGFVHAGTVSRTRNEGNTPKRSGNTFFQGCEMTSESQYSQQEQEIESLKLDVLSRMRRIEGQIRGIQRMVEAGKECEDILVQVKAAKSALQGATRQILKRYMLRCYLKSLNGNGDSETGPDTHELEKVIKVLMSFTEC